MKDSNNIYKYFSHSSIPEHLSSSIYFLLFPMFLAVFLTEPKLYRCDNIMNGEGEKNNMLYKA